MPNYQEGGLWGALTGAASGAMSTAREVGAQVGGLASGMEVPDYGPVIGPNLDELDGYMPPPEGQDHWYGLPDLYGEDNGPSSSGGGGPLNGFFDKIKGALDKVPPAESGGGGSNFEDMIVY